jgi:NAD dependent epimerase/dehydratase family enzyme
LIRILITGASGLIGAQLTNALLAKGHAVSHLSRTEKQGSIKSFKWDVKSKTIDQKAFDEVDVIVHLAGAGVGDKRWSSARKREILETSPVGHDFLAQVVRQWEQEVDRIQGLDIRVVKLRLGAVLSEKGGALKEIIKPIKLGAGAPLGDGNQYMSWIHIDDLCALFIATIENEQMKGAYNAVTPHPATNRELITIAAKVLRKPLILPPIPSFALKLVLGEMASLVLNGSKVSPKKIQEVGFQFKFPKLEEALADLLQ